MAQEAPLERQDLSALQLRLRAEEKKLALMQEVGRALTSAMDLDHLLALIMEKITALMEADRSTLYLLRENGQELWSKVVQGGELHEIRLRVGEGIAGWVAKTGETVNIPDAYSDTRFQPAVDLRSGYRTRSILCMPMVSAQGRTVGVVQVLNKVGGPFTNDDEQLLSALASAAAVSIENSRLYHSMVRKNVELLEAQRQLERRAWELDVLYQIEAEVNAAHDLDEMLDRLLKRAMELVGARAGSIALVDRGTEDLYFRSARGAAGDVVKRLRLPVGQGIVGWVAAQRTAVIVNDPVRDPRHQQEFAEKIGYRPQNLLCAPLHSDEEILGAIELLDKSPEGRHFDEDDLKLLVLIAGQATRGIQLTRAKEEKLNESRLASIGQMLSGVLHDLKTPMTIVSGYAQLMAASDDARLRNEYVDQILKQFEIMSAMTREVLAFARGETHLLVRKVFLHRFLEEMEAHLKHEFAGKSIQLQIDAGYTGVAYFDEQKMLRVIHNLARNASQAMPAGGSFRVSTRVEADRLLFDFVDTGTGIPVEMEGRIFELFATSGKKDGSGLGLAIVKKIVEDHGGSVTYQSSLGAGTVFTVSLPLERPAGAERSGELWLDKISSG